MSTNSSRTVYDNFVISCGLLEDVVDSRTLAGRRCGHWRPAKLRLRDRLACELEQRLVVPKQFRDCEVSSARRAACCAAKNKVYESAGQAELEEAYGEVVGVLCTMSWHLRLDNEGGADARCLDRGERRRVAGCVF